MRQTGWLESRNAPALASDGNTGHAVFDQAKGSLNSGIPRQLFSDESTLPG